MCVIANAIAKTMEEAKYINSTNFSGISSLATSESKIQKCAIGKCKKEIIWKGRIAGEIEYKSISSNNTSIDSNQTSKNQSIELLATPELLWAPGLDHTEIHDGESISAHLFKQRYFENTLGWDFDTVWMWDHEKDHPVLRQVGVRADTSGTPAAPAQANTADLLTQQIRANIWL